MFVDFSTVRWQNHPTGYITSSPLEGKTMAARVLYVGQDDSHRVQVLSCAGYDIRECCSPAEFLTALRSRGGFAAVVFHEDDRALPADIFQRTRAATDAPMVLFYRDGTNFDLTLFDLVVHNLTSPNIWLKELGHLVERGRTPIATLNPRRFSSGLAAEHVALTDRGTIEHLGRRDPGPFTHTQL